jgi:hypothetical protein
MVLALGSDKAGVSFPSVREHNQRTGDPYTAFDIWCAGLSQDTFKGIDDDIGVYRLLLQRSLRPHDAFELEKTNYPLLDIETRTARRRRRVTSGDGL